MKPGDGACDGCYVAKTRCETEDRPPLLTRPTKKAVKKAEKAAKKTVKGKAKEVVTEVSAEAGARSADTEMGAATASPTVRVTRAAARRERGEKEPWVEKSTKGGRQGDRQRLVEQDVDQLSEFAPFDGNDEWHDEVVPGTPAATVRPASAMDDTPSEELGPEGRVDAQALTPAAEVAWARERRGLSTQLASATYQAAISTNQGVERLVEVAEGVREQVEASRRALQALGAAQLRTAEAMERMAANLDRLEEYRMAMDERDAASESESDDGVDEREEGAEWPPLTATTTAEVLSPADKRESEPRE